MITLINQELFKLFKKKSTIILPFITILSMIILAILSVKLPNIFSSKVLIKQVFSGFAWTNIFMIVQASTILSMEFHYGTIKNLLVRKYSRINIIGSKFITLFLYTVIIYSIVLVTTVIIKYTMFSKVNVFPNKGLFQNLLEIGVGNFISLWFILSITLLVSCLIRSTGVSIAVGIVLYFLLSVISGLLFNLIEKWEWIKWNPLNMLNLGSQSTDSTLKSFTKLDTLELLYGNIIYIFILILITIYLFRKKNV